MALPLVSAGLSLVPSLFGLFKGGSQQRRAEQLRRSAVNPGYQMNTGVIDNARILSDRYTNYTLPGYSAALNNINQTYGSAFDRGIQGASSSGDVLDLAARLALGQTGSINQLDMQQAQGREAALSDYLGANAAAGQEYVNKNAWDREQYNRQLNEAAALSNAGQQNVGNAINSFANVGSSLLLSNNLFNKRTPTNQADFSSYQFPSSGPLSGQSQGYAGLRMYNGYNGLPASTYGY